jgi:hypothetical protein
MIERSLTLVGHMGYANLIKGKITEGRPYNIARRGNLIGSENKLPRLNTSHESGGDKWKASL